MRLGDDLTVASVAANSLAEFMEIKAHPEPRGRSEPPLRSDARSATGPSP